MSEFIAWCIDHLNYWTITFLMTLESTVIPIPSELVVPPAAYRAAADSSELNIVLIVLFFAQIRTLENVWGGHGFHP